MEVTRFEKDGQKIWEKNGIFSGCIKATQETFNPETGFVNVTTHMNWVKANSEEVVERMITSVSSMIETGKLVPFRVFSLTPIYAGQEEDINPQTEVKLGRYSQSRLGTPAKALEMDRTFIEVEVPVAKVKVEAEA